MSEHSKRFNHINEGTELISGIAIEKLLCDDFEMFLLVSLVGSELRSNYTNEPICWKYIEMMGSLFETNVHKHADNEPSKCIRCSVERAYCKTLAVIDATNALCGNITIMELSALVLSSENIFLERESIIASLRSNNCAEFMKRMPMIPICQIGKRLKYWRLLGHEVRKIYCDRAVAMLQQLTDNQLSADIMYFVDL